MKKFLASLLLFSGLCSAAQTRVAPAFFGPNAFPVPRMLDGRVADKLQVELAGDCIKGRFDGLKDNTADCFVSTKIPLFSDRVNLSLWWVPQEWYESSKDVLALRGCEPSCPLSGKATGVVYVSTDILLVRETSVVPGLAIRSALRTASEDNAFPIRRSYDAAGYFFDASLGKSFGPFRVSASAGFLCWQTGTGIQNDACMYGVKTEYRASFARLGAALAGYSGWEKCGDCPVSLTADCLLGPSGWILRPYLEYQRGLRDWPFDEFRLGVVLEIYPQ